MLDELARSLAAPMPRRRALKLLAVTLAGAMLPGQKALAAVTGPNASGCPNPGDLFCGNCPNINGLNYGNVCCPGPNATDYWECDCVPGPGGHNGCKRKTCNKCRDGCCKPGQKCCPRGDPDHEGSCCDKDEHCCFAGCCPAGTHCCPGFGKYEIVGRCCPIGWACCHQYCCRPGTHCIDEHGKPSPPPQGLNCSKGHAPPFGKRATSPRLSPPRPSPVGGPRR